MCRWPSYASRIILELWTNENADKYNNNNNNNYNNNNKFIRVLYNGHVQTHLIDSDECMQSGELCNLNDFYKYIKYDMLGFSDKHDHTLKYNEQCNILTI